MNLEKLKEKRESLGLTQADMARGLKISIFTYQTWERGVSMPNSENKEKLKDFIAKQEESKEVKGVD